MDLNKWSPADIYLIRKDFDIGCLAKEGKLFLNNYLNACMQRGFSGTENSLVFHSKRLNG